MSELGRKILRQKLYMLATWTVVYMVVLGISFLLASKYQ